MRSWKNWSLQVTLPLGGGILLLLVIAILSSAAYRELRRSSLVTATLRLSAVTKQLADLIGAASPLLADDARKMAKTAAVTKFLREPDSANWKSAVAAATAVASKRDQLAAIEVWDATGTRLGATGEFANAIDTSRTHTLLSRIDARDTVRVSPLQQVNKTAVYAVVVSIGESAPLGYVVHWRHLRSTPASRTQTQSLIGTESNLYLGNADSELWTDLVEVVPGPPAAIAAQPAPLRYTPKGGKPALGMARRITGTPWALAIGFPMSAITAAEVLFLKNLLIIATLMLVVSVTLWWIVSRRISQPLLRLTQAAEGVGTADFPQHIELTRRDELGRLAMSFNSMVTRLRESTDRLEERVAERTSELNETLLQLQQRETQLEESKNAAERANHAKSSFLAKMSHELRTPLNSIIGFSEILEEQSFGPLNKRQERYVGNVLTSGRQLLDLINDILDLSKVEAGHTELFLESVALPGALADTLTIVSPMATSKFITLELSVDHAIAPVAADATKLKQILCNLLSNAIKFTPEGGRILVAAHQCASVSGAPRMVEIAVSDTGIGISPADQERVFDEFEQVDSAYARTQQGTGLGLALSRRLVELHGGTIWVESEINSGSTFRFTLPVFCDDPVAVPESDAPAFASPAAELDGPLVLVVEDDARARELLVHYLENEGFRTEQLESGENAFDVARDLMPDAITLDIMLPGKLGYEVLAQLKSDPRTANIPVVIVSMTEERELGMSLGAVDWLVKPTRREDFVAAVRRGAIPQRRDGQPTVLLVDDDLDTLDLLKALLDTQGFTVLLADGGRAGVSLAIQALPDVVVVDLRMPDVDGFSVVRQIRQHLTGNKPALVVYSASDITPEEHAQLAGSVDGVFIKGSGRRALLENLHSLTRHTVRQS